MTATDPERPATVTAWLIAPFVWLIRGYQKWISPGLPATCRFTPSCSSYALTALRRHGLLRGGWLAVRRLLRCHPWNPGGVDHVPPRSAKERPARAKPSGPLSEPTHHALRNT